MLPPVETLAGLDVGCGEGGNTRLVARRGARMNAVDVAPTFVRHAQTREAEDPLGIAYAVGDGIALPFGPGRLDFVTEFMSLMDMPDPGAALREAALMHEGREPWAPLAGVDRRRDPTAVATSALSCAKAAVGKSKTMRRSERPACARAFL